MRGWWTEQALPRLVDVFLSERVSAPWRERVCAAATGTVLEVGFGSGHNLPHYGPQVERVLTAEPSDVAWGRAAPRITAFARPVERVSRDAAELPLPDHSVDTVVSTWTMCTIPDLDGALAEMRRVLRPGGRLLFVEHSLAPEATVARVQHGIQPVWGPLAGGCHVDRDLPHRLENAGFRLDDDERGYVSRLWPARPFGWFVVGNTYPVGYR
jgi:ubiquinone/menaquinone biosynthesis C-methylase UbiE